MEKARLQTIHPLTSKEYRRESKTNMQSAFCSYTVQEVSTNLTSKILHFAI